MSVGKDLPTTQMPCKLSTCQLVNLSSVNGSPKGKNNLDGLDFRDVTRSSGRPPRFSTAIVGHRSRKGRHEPAKVILFTLSRCIWSPTCPHDLECLGDFPRLTSIHGAALLSSTSRWHGWFFPFLQAVKPKSRCLFDRLRFPSEQSSSANL